MPANAAPIFTRVADIQWNTTPMTAANNAVDITTGTSYLVYTADADNGGYVQEIRIKVAPGNNSAATVARIWLNNGDTTGTAANSVLFGELGLQSTTTTAVNPQGDFVYPMNIAIPPGYKIYLTFGTAPGGSASFYACVVGGKY